MGNANLSNWEGQLSGLEAKKGWVSDAARMLFAQEGIATTSWHLAILLIAPEDCVSEFVRLVCRERHPGWTCPSWGWVCKGGVDLRLGIAARA